MLLRAQNSPLASGKQAYLNSSLGSQSIMEKLLILYVQGFPKERKHWHISYIFYLKYQRISKGYIIISYWLRLLGQPALYKNTNW